MDLEKLREPFPAEDVEWRIGRCKEGDGGKIHARCLAYIAARAVQDRLDEVCGPENWQVEFRQWHQVPSGEKLGDGPKHSQLCGISIKVAGEWITKWDGAENTDFEPVKGGLSAAMKRAASQWGIGRYLYRLDERVAQILDRDATEGEWSKSPSGKWYRWKPPALPAWALPGESAKPKDMAPQIKEPMSDRDWFAETMAGLENVPSKADEWSEQVRLYTEIWTWMDRYPDLVAKQQESELRKRCRYKMYQSLLTGVVRAASKEDVQALEKAVFELADILTVEAKEDIQTKLAELVADAAVNR